jgi:hypothetical protein
MASNHFGRSRTTVSFHHRLTALIEFRHYMAGPVTRRMLMMELIHLLSLLFNEKKNNLFFFFFQRKIRAGHNNNNTNHKKRFGKKVAGPSPRAKHFLFVLEELSFCKTPLYLLLLLFYTSRVEKERTNFV